MYFRKNIIKIMTAFVYFDLHPVEVGGIDITVPLRA